MEIIKTEIPDVLLIKPKVFNDDRGYFFESWSNASYKEVGITNNWIQDNESKSCFGVLRGLHYQDTPYTQAKLVRVVRGSAIDVVVDIRKGSKTYGKWISVCLSQKNHYQLYIPRGFAHGFVSTSKNTIFQYKCDNVYMKSAERGIKFNDKYLNINWNLFKNNDLFLVSEKDKHLPKFSEIKPLEI